VLTGARPDVEDALALAPRQRLEEVPACRSDDRAPGLGIGASLGGVDPGQALSVCRHRAKT